MTGIIKRACNMACNEVESKLGGNATLSTWHIVHAWYHAISIKIEVEVDGQAYEVGATVDLDLDTIDLQ